MNNYHAEFTRWIWMSAQAREVWEPRIAEITRVWGQVEYLAVAKGIRNAGLLFPTIEELPEATMRAAAHGLLLLPISLEGASQVYSSTTKAYVPGQPAKYRSVLVRPEKAGEALAAWREGNEDAIGRLLGYPSCCTQFYKKVWVDGQSCDTTLAMAESTGGDTTGPPEANILLRWLTVRLVPHLPCSFACEGTIELARKLMPVWSEINDQALQWAKEMLTWPIEWNALHGIAEIKTPVLTISAKTDWTAGHAIVAKQGTSYPDEGAVGLRFPFRVVKDKVTKAPAFQRSVLPVWELNGFSSREKMEEAHSVVLSVLPRSPEGVLLDLGCGNGRLLERAKHIGWQVEGVEYDPVRAGASQIPVRRGDMFDVGLWDREYDVIALMPGRILEATKDDRLETFRSALRGRARSLLVYAYGDWLTRFGGLGPLVAEAGLGAGDVVYTIRTPGVEAALLKFEKAA